MNLTPDLVGPRFQRIRTLSKALRMLCLVSFILIVILGVPSAVFSPLPTAGTPGAAEQDVLRDNSVVRQHSMSFSIGHPSAPLTAVKPGTTWIVRALFLFTIGYTAAGLFIVYRLFDLYGKGVVFNVLNVQRLQQLGWWLLGNVILANGIEVTKFFWSVSPDVHLNLDEKFLAGVLIILIAWIMDEGRQLKEEMALTV